jgi:hypothetical protein
MKKIMLAGVTMLLIAGTVVYANGINKKGECPNTGCKCSASTQHVTNHLTAADSETCPNMPGCICGK